MRSGIIVGSVGVLVRPISRGLNKSLSKAFTGASGSARKAGQEAGRAFSDPVAAEGEKLPRRVMGPLRRNASSEAGQAGATAGSSFASRVVGGISSAAGTIASTIGTVLTTGAKVGGGAAAAALGITLAKGFGRLSAIENAEAKLSGLGHSAESVGSIMDNALASVKGTAYGMDEAATTAASAVAAGIEPGQELESYLRLVGDAASIAGTDMGSMGSIFNKVATSGKVQGDVFAQLGDAGIPIVQLLADQLGVTAEEVYKMGSAGDISSDQFLAAMGAMSGAALEAGNTTTGALKNAGAAISRLGAALLAGVYPMIGQVARRFTELVDVVQKKVEPIIAALMERFGGSATAGIDGFFDRLIGWVEAFDPQTVIDFFDRTATFLGGLDFSSLTGFVSSLTNMGGGQGSKALDGIGASLQAILEASPTLIASALELLGKAMQFLSDNADTIVQYLPHIIAGFVAWRVASAGMTAATQANTAAYHALLPVMLLNNIARTVATRSENAYLRAKLASNTAELQTVGAKSASTLATIRSTIAEKAATAAKKAGALASRALGAAVRFATGPIGLIIAGVALLGTALWAFFTKTEVGKQLWDKIWNGIKNVVAGVVGWFTGTLIPTFQQIIGILFHGDFAGGGALAEDSFIVSVLFTIRETAEAVANWFWSTLVPALQSAWEAISSGALWLYENGILPAWNGIRSAIAAVGDWITGTLWPAIQTAWTAIGTAAMWLWTSVIQPVWNGIKVAIAIAITAILVYIDLLKWYWESVIAPVAMWLWNSVITPVWNGIKTAIGSVVDWFQNTAWPALKAAWDAVAGAATWLWQSVLKPAWDGIRAAIDAVVAWFRDTAWPMLGSVIDWIAAKFDQFKIGLGIIWGFIKNSIINPVVSWFQNTVWPVIDTVLGWIQMSFEGWKIILGAVWDFVKNRIINPVVTWFRDTAWPMLKTVIDLIIEGFRIWRDKIRDAWNFVKNNVINPVITWFRDVAWPLVKRVIDFYVDGFQTMRDKIRDAWNFVKNNVINPVATWFRDTIGPLFSTVTGAIKDAFTTMKDSIGRAWDAVKDKAKAPIRFVVETVVNDALIKNFNKVAGKLGVGKLDEVKLPKGFTGGGILPGQSSWRDGDDQLIAARRGEGVLVSEGLRDRASRALFLRANHEARTTGKSFAEFVTGGFAGGGIIDGLKGFGSRAKEIAGHALDKVLEGVDFVAEALKDPKGMFGKVFDAVAGNIPAAGVVTSAAKSAGQKLLDGVVEKLLGGGSESGAAGTGGLPPVSGGSGTLASARSIAASMGLTLTSGYRPGARTARTGSQSLHALGRAYDFASSMTASGKALMMRLFNRLSSMRQWTELLYSPAGARQHRRGGFRSDTTGATKRMHYNHVHVGLAKGGIIDALAPTLFDSGGLLPPGLSTVVNASRKPEAVLTNDQLLQLRRIADGRGDGETTINNITATSDKAKELIGELMWAQRTQPRRGRYARAGG